MGKFTVVNHPLVANKVTMLRDINTGYKEFREIVEEISALICYEATRDLPLTDIEVETPICKTKSKTLDKKIALVPILRAGLGMETGLIKLIPTAHVGHIGAYRDPITCQAVVYYSKLPPDVAERNVLLLDPMLASGGTVTTAIDILKKKGCKNIKLLCILSCPEGLARVHGDHPDIDIYTAAHDEGLNAQNYIVPGLGDAGDRLFGTK